MWPRRLFRHFFKLISRRHELEQCRATIAQINAKLHDAWQEAQAREAELRVRDVELQQVRETLNSVRASADAAMQKLATADREHRLRCERDARQLEIARAETWELRQRMQELEKTQPASNAR